MAKKYIEYEGKKFPNDTELDFYKLLKSLNINFIHQHKILLMEESENGKDIYWNVDFYLKDLDIVIDTKGCLTNLRVAELKRRLLEDKYEHTKALFVYKVPSKTIEKILGTKFMSEDEEKRIKKVIKAAKEHFGIKGNLLVKFATEEMRKFFYENNIYGIFGDNF